MAPRPKVVLPEYRGSGKLAGKVALIPGGDSAPAKRWKSLLVMFSWLQLSRII